ncbi:hypothetical protein K4K52_012674 [Colletotrichum sp. SAR 10_76]|nr:hypothetical protein K4K52_012674 [Colletotrichum sp. SAR 10_76]
MNQWEHERLENMPKPRIVMLHDNSVSQSRGWDEPLLYVPDSPATILPSGPLQVEYNWEDSKDSGTPHGDGSEDAYDSMELRSSHHLCVACKHTFNHFCKYNEVSGDERISMQNNVLHSESILSLFMFANLANCFICRKIWSKIKTMYPNLDPNRPSSYRVECCWTIDGGLSRETKMWMVLYDSSVPRKPSYNYQHVLRIGLWPTAHYGIHFGKDTDQRTVLISCGARGVGDDLVKDDTTESAKTISLAQSWFARCTQNTNGQHDICNRKEGTYLPTRLLDVRSALERGQALLNVFKGEIKFQIQFANLAVFASGLQHRSAEDRLDKIHQLWNSTCQDLSNKSVTYASDLPVILSSLAKEFQALMPDDEYVAGLWRSTLVEALTCPVKLYHPGHVQRKRAVAEIIAIDNRMDPSSDNPYSQLLSGSSLRVRGFLRRLHFHFVGPPSHGIVLSVVEKGSDGRDRLRVIGPDWDKHEGLAFRLTTDGMVTLPYQELECFALFTTLNEWAQFLCNCRRRLSCILLEKVTGDPDHGHEDESVYRRIGTLEDISDTYSFKMRYRVAENSTVREAGLSRDMFEENPTGYAGKPQPETWFHGEEDVGAAESDETDVAGDEVEASSSGRRDSASSTDADYAEGEIWIWLVQYIQRKRWSIIREYKEQQDKEKGRMKGSSNLEQLGIRGQRTGDEGTDGESQVDNYGSLDNNIANEMCDDQDDEQEEAEENDKGNEHSDQGDDEDEDGKEKADNSKEEDDNNGQEDSDSRGDSSEEEDRHREDLHLSVVIVQIHNNPSSDLAPIGTAGDTRDAWKRLQEAKRFISQTMAYGENQPQDPAAALYQFDDVLHQWQELRGVVPWLERLETIDITLV